MTTKFGMLVIKDDKKSHYQMTPNISNLVGGDLQFEKGIQLFVYWNLVIVWFLNKGHRRTN